ncbi:P-loop containing nucleoside triphosphate hydrolase protein [Neurospora crassa]|uniref:Leptomycin B resistance protein pmd1 n=2 Tax=Neurospora crassa TaxID=5141 RepID=Q1K8N7_NEUCR|nr:leptomycin B resistance protein pmd1 [Neurospora crassa OR74A]EAA34173.1 leptomycin B resistance protein pmd1 [Neurospora crassa OR74A]KHE82425.1 P-loop containing nucleoside triphosphate hydrolase protein [Neurospora crassa]CAD70511.1 related to multidrug resistance protein [Neurospora crassa]|eukprot:XP_963409.1 leptomycin B resistance protein pmd1 [Neurospora crassa OR74A]
MSAEEKGLAENPPAAPETPVAETAVATPPPPAPPKEPLTKKLFGYVRIFFSADPTWTDYLLLLIGTISALAAGVPFPLMGIVFGQLVDDMNGATCAVEQHDTNPFRYEHDINDKVLIIVYIAIAAFCLIYIYVLSWSLISQRLAARLRNKYVSALLRQPPAFFDTRAAGGEVSTRLHGDMAALQAGTSEKVGVLLASISFFITAYVVAFIKQAKLAGILISMIPAYLAMGLVGGAYFQKYMIKAAGAIASASSIASEALKNVIVVQAFGAAPRLEAKFADHMATARDAGIKRGMSAAVQAGLLYFIAYAGNALAFWEGSRMVADAMAGKGSETIGQIYTVIFILVDACVVLGNISPLLPLLGGAQAAFDRLMKDIDEPSPIDGTSDKGVVLPFETRGEIRFENVSFSYPSRPDQLVLKNVDLTFPAGKHTAIVGLSGSGKSTVAAMISRLQDPNSGRITMDGYDLKELNVRSLRSFISLVQQEPSLLDRSILENIALGLINSPKPEHQRLKDILHSHELADLAKKGKDSIDPTIVSSFGPLVQEIINLIQHAATEADAAGFIERLEKGYGTYAGPSGSMVSGGQRQRVALARALIRDPKILLLDEATSALDSASERRIQEAVDRAAKSRTVISIAHRLSTIRNADKIVVMEAGKVIEEGSYDELMAKEDGAFAKMANLQTLGTAHKAEAGSSVSGESIESSSSATGTSVEKPSAPEVAVTPAPPPAVAEAAAPSGDEIAGLDTNRPLSSVVRSLGRFLRPSLGWLVIAIFAAVIVGGTFSGSGVLFGFTISSLNPCSGSMDKVLYYGKFFGGFLFMLACIEFFANFAAWSCFALIAEKLLYAMRVLSFRSLMEQGVQWHQSEGRSPSSLLTIITKDSASVGAFSGSTIGTVFSICVNFIAAIILSHIFAWKIAIVCLSIVPILLGTGLMQLRMLARYEERHAEAFNKATSVAVEAVQTIKTVAALSLEHEVLGSYQRLLKNNRDEMVKAAAFTNIWLALANSISFLVYAFAYWWGSQRIMHGEYSQRDFFIVLVAMLVSAQLWGQMFSLAPEFSRARLAISRILGVIGLGSNDHVHDSSSPASKTTDPEATGESSASRLSPQKKSGVQITFSDVSFAYPSRPDHPVLDSVSFTIQPGQFVGLVGPSGAGKSTIMNLVQRLYSPTSGSITIDGVDISSTQSSNTFRDSIALVPQEPALFDGSVKFNVGLGARPGHEASDAEIEEACRLASIHDVIASLPEGYETECGASASRLSGGQRQRLAIARALVRKPRLLLLDESTSALDAASEAALQEGLEKVARDTTVLAITHRLHTVQKADVIFVVEGGKVVDRGTHSELMARRESYRVNAMQQMLQ